MRKSLRNLLSGLLSCALALSLSVAASAADPVPGITFNGGTSWTSIPISSGSAALFDGAMENLMPGDSGSFALQLRNGYNTGVTFHLRLAALTDEGALAALEAAFGKQYSDTLLDNIRLTVSYGDGVIYEGSMSGKDITTGSALYGDNGVVLGRLSANAAGTLTITYAIAQTLGNEYADTLASLTWDFAAVVDAPSPGPSPSPSPSPDPSSQPSEPVDDEIDLGEDPDVPMGDLPVLDDGTADGDDADAVIILDPNVPLGNLPQTGTMGSAPGMTILVPVSVTLLALVALCAALLLLRKTKRHT